MSHELQDLAHTQRCLRQAMAVSYTQGIFSRGKGRHCPLPPVQTTSRNYYPASLLSFTTTRKPHRVSTAVNFITVSVFQVRCGTKSDRYGQESRAGYSPGQGCLRLPGRRPPAPSGPEWLSHQLHLLRALSPDGISAGPPAPGYFLSF